ncbi:MAG: OmpA family protein [Syntrophotaleaceae bacterium]
MKRLRSFLPALMAVLLTFVLSPGGANAANRSGAFSLSPMAGGYVFEGDQDLDDALTYSLGLGYNLTDTWSTEFVLNYFDADAGSGAGDDVDGLVYRLDALYHFIPDSPLVPFIAGGLGGITLDPDRHRSNTDFLLNYGVGLKYFLTDSLAFRGDLRHIFAFGDPQNNFIYSAGLIYQFGGQDKTPAPIVQPLDSDGDGVHDGIDKCPGTPAGAAVDSAGCRPDSDGDKVPDDLDACSGTPKGIPVDERGCPRDSDGDGVPDHVDRCPATPSSISVDRQGCPRDSDGDGVFDPLDNCPGTAKGVMVNDKGCPVSLTLSIRFDVGQADIKQGYRDELARAAAFVRKYPDQKILIAGHTDATGSASRNRDLSLRRAESVRAYLIENFNIDGSRLHARGYGESVPIADNGSAEGRRRNRRVEIVCCMVVPG